MKIVLIGAGSFVFAPTVLKDIIIKNRLSECEVSLVDLNFEMASAMKGLGKRMAEEEGIEIDISAGSDRREMLPGADFVIMSAAPEGRRRWLMDYQILKEAGMPDQARECGGLGGLANSLRAISMVMDVCLDMEELCPDAMLLDVTNPMPRVVTAVNKYTAIKAAGFCNIAWRGPKGYEWLAAIMERRLEDIKVATAGLNHFSWVVGIRDAQTGQDLFPELQYRIANGDIKGIKDDSEQARNIMKEIQIIKRWMNEYGGIVAGSVDHHAEFLPYDPDISYNTQPPYHGNEKERQQRLNLLTQVAWGERKWQEVLDRESWEHPVDVAAAINRKEDRYFDMINIPNDGYIPNIPPGRIVEVPAWVRGGQLKGVEVPALPEGIARICNTISDVHEMVAESAVKGDIALARQAVEIDPSIIDKQKAVKVLDKMIKAHLDILPRFS